MTSDAPLHRLERKISACWRCRMIIHRGSHGGLCEACQEESGRCRHNADSPHFDSLPERLQQAQRERIARHSLRVEFEMRALGILPDGWANKEIPHSVRERSEKNKLRSKETSAADLVEVLDVLGLVDDDEEPGQVDDFDRVRRRDVEKALANLERAEFLAWSQEMAGCGYQVEWDASDEWRQRNGGAA